MRTLIILKGIAKTEKDSWVRKSRLDDFYVDINVLKRAYSYPEPKGAQGEVYLGRSFIDVVYLEYLRILCFRLSKGCLVVTDPENEGTALLEKLALTFGYKVFYKVFGVPQDFLSKPNKYNLPYYPKKTREELSKMVNSFLSHDYSEKTLINKYSDVRRYWVRNSGSAINLKGDSKVIHVSDLHSNWTTINNYLSGLEYSPDLIVFHGDYVDGPEQGGSRKLMDWMISEKDNPGKVWIEGNHELRVRKFLGAKVLKAYSSSGNRRDYSKLLLDTLPKDFMETTAKEFEGLTSKQALEYLESMNTVLKTFVIVKSNGREYICTHGGLKYLSQISPELIGNVLYGNRDIQEYDKVFTKISERSGKDNLWSIHGHCYYPDSPEVSEVYRRVVNLDPVRRDQVIILEQTKNGHKITKL